jgi:hypothetical protein
MVDPTAGVLKFDNADLSLAVNLAISAQTAETANPDISAFINTWGSSTNIVKGIVTIKKQGAPQTFALFAVTGVATDNATWLEMPVAYVAGNGAFALSDEVYISFSRAGDKGAGDLIAANNLSELTDKAAARTNLEIATSPTEYSKTQNFNATALVDAVNISWDLQSNQVASVTLAGNRTLDNPTNQVDGATYILKIKQDATGGRTLAFGSAYKFPDATAPTLSSGANAVDRITCVSDGTNMDCVFQGNFS